MSNENNPEPKAERTCVGCRKGAERSDLLRFVRAENGALAPDVRARLSGRGAWVHPMRDCLNLALTRGGFQRAFQSEVSAELTTLAQVSSSQYRRRMDGLLLAARRTHKLAIGTDAVRGHLKSADGENAMTMAALVVAEDGENRREALWQAAGRLGQKCMIHGTRDSLGSLLGRPTVSVVGILDKAIAAQAATAVARATALLEAA